MDCSLRCIGSTNDMIQINRIFFTHSRGFAGFCLFKRHNFARQLFE